jgi:SAM-dependent methyltransferase
MSSFDAKNYWDQRASAYCDTMHTDYYKNRLAMVDALIGESDMLGSVVDFGCGNGIHVERCAALGGAAIGIDIEPKIVNVTRQRIATYKGNDQVLEGGIERLFDLESGSYDTILALNVLAYLDGTQCDTFYRQAARILRKGGASCDAFK